MSVPTTTGPAPHWRPAAPPARARRDPPWRSVTRAARPRRTRRRWLLPLAAAFFVCLVAFLWALTWLRPLRPVGLVLIGSDYALNLAVEPDVEGWRSLHDLDRLSATGELYQLRGGPARLRKGDAWDRDLDKVAEKTLFLVLGLHGGCDPDGPYVLPEDADPGPDPSNRLRVAAVLDRLAKLPASMNKVLVLDATRQRANWSFGALTNDFARGMDDLADRVAAVPNLVVIGTSGPDQLSWVSEDLGRTAFAHFLLQVLRDAPEDHDADGRLTLLDVFRAVRDRVQRWVWLNRSVAQVPVMWPAGAEGDARARRVGFAPARGLPADDPADAPEFTLPPELAPSWEAAAALAADQPYPWVNSPGLWREYLDLMVRHERLLLAGDRGSAAAAADRAADLARQIDRRRRLDLRALDRSLALAATAGYDLADADDPPDALWDATAEDAGKLWAKLTAAAPDRTSRVVLKARAGAMVLRRASEDPVGSLDRAVRLARLFDAPDPVRPAELHFLVMLRRDMPDPPPPPDLLARVLRVRSQAERATLGVAGGDYPYSGTTHTWAKDKILEADRRRRDGEDRVFGAGPDWDAARTALAAAEALYTEAQAVANDVRVAMAARDEAGGRLPYLARWCARRQDEAPGRTPAVAVKDVEAALAEMHALGDDAERGPGGGRTPADLAKRGRDLAGRMREFRRHGLDYFRQLADADLASVWRDLNDALTLPLFDTPEVRMRMVLHQRRTSRKFLRETAAATDPFTLPSAADQAAAAASVARRQGRMAMAVLGRAQFDALDALAGASPERPETYDLVRHRLDTFEVESGGWASLRAAGAEVGRRWAEVPAAVDRLAKRAGAEGTARALADLVAASDLARVLDGAGTARLTAPPRSGVRAARTHELLTFLATRTFDDHWFAESPDADPYYRAAGRDFLADADQLVNGDALSADLHRRIDGPGELTLTGPPRIALTTERRLAAAYQLRPAKGAVLPEGTAVLRAAAGPGLEASAAEATTPVGGDRPPQDVRFSLTSPKVLRAEPDPPPTPDPVASSLAVRGLFRGQRLERVTPAELYPAPEVRVCSFPGPQRASLAVRADPATGLGRGYGAVAIVLDCSGSMRPPEGEAFGPTTKYVEAVAAVRDMLRGLPRGTTVSLWTFGQAVGAARTAADANTTVRRLIPPTAWEGDDAQLRSVVSQISYPATEPWNESPIVRAMIRAKSDLVSAAGSRSLVVVTDGEDNQFERDAELNPTKRPVAEALREAFADSGIAVDVVGFKVVSAEQESARRQFAGVTKFGVPGRFLTVERVEDLTAALRRSLRARVRYLIETEDNVPVPGLARGGQDAAPEGSADQWFAPGLAPGGYQVRVASAPAVSKDVVLRPADRLLARLVPDRNNSARFERVVWAEDYPTRPWREAGGWRAAVLGERATDAGGVGLLATLEKRPDRRETVLEEVRPRAVWWEMTSPSGSASAAAVRWYDAPGYPAATTILESPLWPAGDGAGVGRPVLRGWWSPDRDVPPGGAFDRGADFSSLDELTDRPLPLAGDEVRIESVSAEDHAVEVRPGVREVRPCLVVRVRHPLGRPAWVTQTGLNPRGQEHRYFARAGASTSLFWPVTPEEAGQLRRLALVSIEAFKGEAERRGFYAEFRDLAVPDPNGPFPRPPLP